MNLTQVFCCYEHYEIDMMKRTSANLLLLLLLTSAALAGGDEARVATVSASGLTLKVYNFNALESQLHRDGDTTFVVNFWATWCAPCVKELPHFERLGSEFQKDNVKVLLVSLDFRKHIKSKLIPFILDRKLESEVVVLDDPDANEWIDRVSTSWSGAIPATLIYRGNRRSFFEQSFTYEELETAVTTMTNGILNE